MFDVSLLLRSKLSQHSSHLEHAIARFFESGEAPSRDILDECDWQETLGNREVIVANWKRLLLVHLLCRIADVYSHEMTEKVKEFYRLSGDENSFFVRIIISFHHSLARMPHLLGDGFLSENGSVSMEKREYSPWLSLPYHPEHLELGVYVCCLALLTEEKESKEFAFRMARWELNTLDAEGRPLHSLFTKENEANDVHQVCWTYLFFRSAAALCSDGAYGTIAKNLANDFHRKQEIDSLSIDPLFLLMDKWLSFYPILSSESFSLSEHIYDPSTALVGYRSSTHHVLCTLHGVNTGLGIIRHGDVGIINYGPQYLPLEECQGFGIEGNAFSDQGMRKSIIEWKPQSFSLKGCVKVIDQPVVSGRLFRGIWFEVMQEYKPPHFHLSVDFLGLDRCEDLVFSFFIKAAHCKLGSCVLLPRTLDRFEGNSEKVMIESNEHKIVLESSNFQGKLQVIPLCGGNHFWGADFLVAYSLHPDQKSCQWQVSFSK